MKRMLCRLIPAVLIALLVAGCDFHEEPPPMPGSYTSEVFALHRTDSTIDVQSVGGFLEMQLSGDGDHAVTGRVVIPQATLSKNQPTIDTTFAGTYFDIVNQVKINFDNRAPLVPGVWEYDDGKLRSTGQPEIVLVKR